MRIFPASFTSSPVFSFSSQMTHLLFENLGPERLSQTLVQYTDRKSSMNSDEDVGFHSQWNVSSQHATLWELAPMNRFKKSLSDLSHICWISSGKGDALLHTFACNKLLDKLTMKLMKWVNKYNMKPIAPASHSFLHSQGKSPSQDVVDGILKLHGGAIVGDMIG